MSELLKCKIHNIGPSYIQESFNKFHLFCPECGHSANDIEKEAWEKAVKQWNEANAK